jgi:hypothetical protein
MSVELEKLWMRALQGVGDASEAAEAAVGNGHVYGPGTADMREVRV